ncbi:hypothetical protein, partial [uncultured Treponema sp.]|uniref:hypothetical protein n=1 Tax=uncultured Treponema sp. TaxID=162155 RepID=UPI0025F12F57
CSPDACMLRMLRLLLAQNPSFFRVRFRARPGLQPGCLHASHAAAFACAKPVFFSCALSRTAGLAARIGTPELPERQ